MTEDVDARISRLLDQLDGPDLSDRKRERIMRQVELLQQQELQQA
jgi:hypothetical protein